ncbi:sodium-dependent nutrient amino acid transporter 1-like [Pollicipes pollicipes]|uniref:sodium-dependent nutrient amino acid transporter 1-like n=1 Tax=Pollicipes pollicipes TaxID=41117 RepID=UPI0018850674|nr:sodium-dependent nutrient amino acid transporter 1-like [Pollicipes pollicipes]
MVVEELPLSGPDQTKPAAGGLPAEEANAQTDDALADDGEPPRQRWGNRVEFLLSCIAMSVGLGNVWRFPYTAYKNGGGAFLIPYVIVLLTIGKPLYYMELALGQFSAHGSVRVWSVVPAVRGVGYGQMIATSAVVSYYVALMALTVFYFFASFATVLPWTQCDPSWADMTRCVDPSTNVSLLNGSEPMGATEMYFQRMLAGLVGGRI